MRSIIIAWQCVMTTRSSHDANVPRTLHQGEGLVAVAIQDMGSNLRLVRATSVVLGSRPGGRHAPSLLEDMSRALGPGGGQFLFPLKVNGIYERTLTTVLTPLYPQPPLTYTSSRVSEIELVGAVVDAIQDMRLSLQLVAVASAAAGSRRRSVRS